jgi:hypothetical protein
MTICASGVSTVLYHDNLFLYTLSFTGVRPVQVVVVFRPINPKADAYRKQNSPTETKVTLNFVKHGPYPHKTSHETAGQSCKAGLVQNISQIEHALL